jgi:hypothetical protein
LEYYLKNVRPLLQVLALLLIGTLMISSPHAMDVENPEGFKEQMKEIISFVWGIPLGIVVICIALFLGYRHFNKPSKSSN